MLLLSTCLCFLPCPELGYNIKFVEEHGRPIPKDPYSIRETGVYQKFDLSADQSNWIFIQPSEVLSERLHDVFCQAANATAFNQFQIHAVVLLTASENWRYYINHLEDTFSTLVSI